MSTADELRFEGDDVFSAIDPDTSGFTVAEPRAFGFFDANPGTILIESSTLEVGESETLSLVGGDITIDGAQVRTEAGTINLSALSGPGEADFSAGELSGDEGADILLTNQAIFASSGNGGNTINARGSSLRLNKGASIIAHNTGENNVESGIDILFDVLELSDNSAIETSTSSLGDAGSVVASVGTLVILNGSTISSTTFGSGNANTVEVRAGDIFIDSQNSPSPFTGITSLANPTSTGNAGDVSVTAGKIRILDRGVIGSSTFSSGDGGTARVTADQIFIDGDDAIVGQLTGIGSIAFADSSGNAGQVIVTAGSLKILNGGAIGSSTFASGNSNTVSVTAGQVTIDATDAAAEEFTGITSLSNPGSSGDAGIVIVRAVDLQILRGGDVTSETFGSGDAGTVTVAAEKILIDGSDAPGASTSISSEADPGSSGDAGEVIVIAEDIDLLNGGNISSSTSGSGNAGTVQVRAKSILIDGSELPRANTGITSEVNPTSGGRAGLVTVLADRLEILNSGIITSSTLGSGDAGTVRVVSEKILIDGLGTPEFFTGITSQATPSADGNAGDVIVTADRLEVRNRGAIVSSSFTPSGNAGSVIVTASNLDMENDGIVASDAFLGGASGDVILTARKMIVDGAQVRTLGQAGEGGRIRLTGSESIVLSDSLVTSNGIEPQEGSSLIELNGKVIALNDSRVTSLTGDGEPITGSGVVDVNGEVTLISTDSLVDASSSVAISGLLNDFSNQLIVLDNQFVDASRLLRESCESGGDLGGSTFVTSGQSPLILPGDGLLPGFYSGALATVRAEGNTNDPVVLVVPCPEAKAG